MRKILFFISLFALCHMGLFGQEIDLVVDKPYRMAIGPKAGVGLSIGSHSNQQNLDFSPGLSYQFGLAFNAHFGRRYDLSDGGTGKFGFQLEALYAQRNIKLSSTTIGEKCLEIPVLAQFFVTSSFGIEAGATVVHVIGCTPAVLDYQETHYHTGDISGNDVMLSVGACYKSPKGLLLDVRGNLGSSGLAGNFDTKVSTVMLSVAYLFTIVK